jgi:outer membrane lipoprotein-sorting protein
MNIRAAILFLASLTAGAGAAELSSSEAAALEARFFAAQRQTRTLEADFTQTVAAPGLAAPVVSRGLLAYRAPDDLRISYSQPAGEWMQLDAANFTTLRHGRAAVVRAADHPSGRALGALRDILHGRRPPGEMHAAVTRRGDSYVVVLTPSADGGFQPERIENTIDAATLQLRSLSLTLPRGTVMRFDFSAIRRNRPLPDDSFTLP